jgi:hypothetical protein
LENLQKNVLQAGFFAKNPSILPEKHKKKRISEEALEKRKKKVSQM